MRPDSELFRHKVLSLIKQYPQHDGYQFDWKGYGVANDIFYQGEPFITKRPEHKPYCSGITLEVFVRAWQATMGEKAAIGDLDREGLERFRKAWYGVDGNRRTLVNAIANLNVDKAGPVGQVIRNLDDWLPGDFVQFWRRPTKKYPQGTGHSCILLGLGERIEYWSAQGSTDGIGLHSERRPEKIYLARVGLSVEEMEARGIEPISKGPQT